MNKQIEEIKAVLVRTCKRVRTMQEDHMQDRYAEALYTAGYRKQKEGEWISVEERLPEKSNHYIVCANTHYGTNFVTIALYTVSCGWNGVKVTHWMPLPMPPKGDEGK